MKHLNKFLHSILTLSLLAACSPDTPPAQTAQPLPVQDTLSPPPTKTKPTYSLTGSWRLRSIRYPATWTQRLDRDELPVFEAERKELIATCRWNISPDGSSFMTWKQEGISQKEFTRWYYSPDSSRILFRDDVQGTLDSVFIHQLDSHTLHLTALEGKDTVYMEYQR